MEERALLDETDHRPWPLPDRPWVLSQSWRDLLFAHWPVPAAELRPLVPPGLEVDVYEGTGWVGLVPFHLTDLRVRPLPPVPGLARFPETNLRTYVRVAGRAGIHFFTLDASSRIAVAVARRFFHLPYRAADMRIEHRDGEVRYRSRRRDGRAELTVRYRPVGSPTPPAPRSLEHFLTERYAFFTVDDGGTVLRGDIHHRPWRIRPAEAELERSTFAEAHGIRLPDTPPLLHFSERQDAVAWLPVPAGEG